MALAPLGGEYSREAHFAQMIALLGPPPQEVLRRVDKGVYSDLYTTNGMHDPLGAHLGTFTNRGSSRR